MDQVMRFHNDTLAKLRHYFSIGDASRYSMLESQYAKWCEREGVMEEIPSLTDIEIRPTTTTSTGATTQAVASTSSVLAKPNKGKMTVGTTVSHTLPPLPTFFDAGMRDRSMYISLAVFIVQWILADAAFTLTKNPPKTLCPSQSPSYSGTKVGNKMRMSFLQWLTASDLQIRYYREVYHGDDGSGIEIGDRLEVHKLDVMKIKAELKGKWMAAFRYFIAHRRNIWTFRLPDGSLADVGTRNKDLLKEMIEESIDKEDHRFEDNPYALGHSLQHISPYDGSNHEASTAWDAPQSANEFLVNAITGRTTSHLPSIASTSTKPVSGPRHPTTTNTNQSQHGRERTANFNAGNQRQNYAPVQAPVGDGCGPKGSYNGWDGTGIRPTIGEGSFVPKAPARENKDKRNADRRDDKRDDRRDDRRDFRGR